MQKAIKFVSMLLLLPILSACIPILMPAPVVTIPPEDLMQTAVYLVSQTAVVAQYTPTTQAWPATHTPELSLEVSATPEDTLAPIVTENVTLTPTSTPACRRACRA